MPTKAYDALPGWMGRVRAVSRQRGYRMVIKGERLGDGEWYYRADPDPDSYLDARAPRNRG